MGNTMATPEIRKCMDARGVCAWNRHTKYNLRYYCDCESVQRSASVPAKKGYLFTCVLCMSVPHIFVVLENYIPNTIPGNWRYNVKKKPRNERTNAFYALSLSTLRDDDDEEGADIGFVALWLLLCILGEEDVKEGKKLIENSLENGLKNHITWMKKFCKVGKGWTLFSERTTSLNVMI